MIVDKIPCIILLLIVNVIGYYCVPVLLDYLHSIGLNSLLIRSIKQNSNLWLVAALIILLIEWLLLMYLFYHFNRLITQSWPGSNNQRLPVIITGVLAIVTGVRLVSQFYYLVDKIR
jgi:hypothetical protein